MEGAIGLDCRRLADGRKAKFGHTFLHRRFRRDFFERRDTVMLLMASYVATAGLASNIMVDLENAKEIVGDRRASLAKAMFPYVEFSVPKRDPEKIEDYDEYFDELDAIDEEQKASNGENDIINKEK